MRLNLKIEREKKNLTQEQLAKQLNVSEVFIRKLESGSSNPSSSMAVEFAEFFERPLDYLFPDIFLLSFDTKRIDNELDKNKEVV
ncbi:helix-turn-helix transcriptional regulator [Enterococcus hulanensis]|uniref:helix-turn-helix transcriptional regulator n=1 Tax=Enterococcus hulanensis TaxID=2559929 RepID=UPI001A8CE459|nr:helix-turn-helix transcriptional regulator [Enterococcus hulanensis]MBO0460077.1 helix-turn-helix transcriptional regulator [Enterococcus hulanensis]